MGNEVSKRSFGVIVEGLTRGQRKYLSLVVRGMEGEEAERVVEKWCGEKVGGQDGEKFKGIAREVIEGREEYREEAVKVFIENMVVMAQEVLYQVLERGAINWGECDRTEKNAVMDAIKIVAKGSEVQAKVVEGIDEIILKMREKP